MNCHYIKHKSLKQVFIPGCIGGAVYGPNGCTCGFTLHRTKNNHSINNNRMLYTRELRIGNWVMTNKPEQAVDVLCDSLSTLTHKCMTMDNLSPIDLTPDVLIKCGFKEHDTFKQLLLPCTGGLLSHQCYQGVHGVAYERDWEDDLIEPHNDLFITSLHRLQNFYYAVTGEELRVEL